MKKKGRNNVTVDDLVNVIMPKGRGKISFFPIFIIYLTTIFMYLFIHVSNVAYIYKKIVYILIVFCFHKHYVCFILGYISSSLSCIRILAWL